MAAKSSCGSGNLPSIAAAGSAQAEGGYAPRAANRFRAVSPSASSAGAVRGVSGGVKNPESLFLSFPALNTGQGGLLLTHPETHPLPAALPAAVVPEQRRDGGSRGPILVACVRLQESEGRAPWAAGSRGGWSPRPPTITRPPAISTAAREK